MTLICQNRRWGLTCRIYLFNRYKEFGVRGLEDRSKNAYRHPNKIPFQIEKAILRIKQDYESWGAPRPSGPPLLQHFCPLTVTALSRGADKVVQTHQCITAQGCAMNRVVHGRNDCCIPAPGDCQYPSSP
jgi:hypothetical protein